MSSSQNSRGQLAVARVSSSRAAARADSSVKSVWTRGTGPSTSRSTARRRSANVGRSCTDGDVPDPPVPQLEQVPHRGLGAALGIQAHGRMAAALGLDHDDRLGARGAPRRVDLEQQQPVGRSGPQRLGRARAPLAVVVRVDQRHRVPGCARGRLGAAQQPAEERVRDVGNHQRDGPRGSGLQRPRGRVGAVAQLLGRRADRRLGPRGDPPRRLPGEDQRHRRLRHAACPRDVDARDSVGAQGPEDWQHRARRAGAVESGHEDGAHARGGAGDRALGGGGRARVRLLPVAVGQHRLRHRQAAGRALRHPQHDWTAPPKPASCELDWGSGVVVGRHGRAEIVCAGDTTLGEGRHLAYGDAIARGRFRCVSRRRGMRCVNRRNDHGFALSRERVRRF